MGLTALIPLGGDASANPCSASLNGLFLLKFTPCEHGINCVDPVRGDASANPCSVSLNGLFLFKIYPMQAWENFKKKNPCIFQTQGFAGGELGL
jgi:hypothetical protein